MNAPQHFVAKTDADAAPDRAEDHATDQSSRDVDVLYVDDSPSFCEMAADLLERERESLTVVTETDPVDALNRVQQCATTTEQFDCIVSDYQMPQMNGVELLRTVREDWPDMPRILYTVEEPERILDETARAEVTLCFQKTNGVDQFAELADRIHNVT